MKIPVNNDLQLHRRPDLQPIGNPIQGARSVKYVVMFFKSGVIATTFVILVEYSLFFNNFVATYHI